jgi:hypothetical protein
MGIVTRNLGLRGAGSRTAGDEVDVRPCERRRRATPRITVLLA